MTAHDRMLEEPGEATRFVRSELGGDPGLPARVDHRPTGNGLASPLPVMTLARAATSGCALAAAELLAVRCGSPVPAVRVDEGAVATAFTSERHLLIDGPPGATFAPLSRFWPTADGWLRTHATYPHHRARLLAALGVTDNAAGPDALVARAAAVIAETDSPVGRLRYALPPVRYEGAPVTWSRQPGRPAADPPSW